MTSVAPNSFAAASLFSSMSMAMTREAPAATAPWMTLSPTPPQPTTATVWPACTRAVLVAAPTPVMTLQPTRAAHSMGTSSGTWTRAVALTSCCSAKADMPANWVTTWSFMLRRSWRPRRLVLMQRKGRPCTQLSQKPQEATKATTTRSPGWTLATSSPTCSTMPADSWPRTAGQAIGYLPSMKWRSEWQTPVALVRITTSLARGSSSSTSSMTRGWSTPYMTAAFMADSLHSELPRTEGGR